MSKNPYYQNGEGYTDNTAGAAITGVVREEKRERKDIMAKETKRGKHILMLRPKFIC